MSVREKKRTTLVYVRAGFKSYFAYLAARALCGRSVVGYSSSFAEELAKQGYKSFREYAEVLAVRAGWSCFSDFMKNSYWTVREQNAQKAGVPLNELRIWQKDNIEYEGVQGRSKETKPALQWLIKKTQTEAGLEGKVLSQGMIARQTGLSRALVSLYARGECLPKGDRAGRLLRALIGKYETLEKVVEAYRAHQTREERLSKARKPYGVVC